MLPPTSINVEAVGHDVVLQPQKMFSAVTDEAKPFYRDANASMNIFSAVQASGN